MHISDNKFTHIATDVKYSEKEYGAVCAIITEDSLSFELRWATGSKIVQQEDV